MDREGVIHRTSSSSPVGDKEKMHYSDMEADAPRIRGLETSAETSLHRGLQARHITMIAIGGAIGTGLIIGTGKALTQAGPGSIFISYSILGMVVFLVMAALGEMAAWLPMSAGFTAYASRFCDPSLGFALGWTYWFKYIIVTPNQLTAASLVIQFWVPRDRVNPGVFIAIFLVAIICINYFGIRFFGEFEFWLSSFKVVVIVGVILLTLIIATGGVDGDPKGFRYWNDPGAFRPYLAEGALGQFLGFWSTMVTATFAYLGTELVGVTVGEAQNPRRTIPRAIRLTFYRIVFFYCISILLVGMCVPYNSEDLINYQSGTTASTANASPFVAAIKAVHIPVLDHILNACILGFVFSAANSDLYIASRTLYGLSSDGAAPSIFRKTNDSGVPLYSLGVSALFGLLAFMNVSDDSKKVFSYFVNLTTIFGLMTWISILVTHIYFVRARKAQGLPNEAMPYVAPLGAWGSYAALFMCCLIALTKNFDVFIGDWSEKYPNFITGYLGIPVYLLLIFGHKLRTKSKGVRAHECDFYTGKDIIDREEEEFLAAKAAKRASDPQKASAVFYKRFVSWLF
ncbi:amino acid permease/ SLC12A domain-containing protein [Durotheca rogersii]|uniref:amino acid permease/ SLC12A domain-containing protein n=1 Tax=Durotheca rogersii TaxID=419775 RepID=UPI00221F130B|nr:amino acid permease/ SLC12A domain-containing protein [Durotheca rogersii]KAI5863074.1 amino acid permease/ SLC12A domain-containing protein [Durotheca rogersii]